MWARAWVCALLTTGVVLGCGSQSDDAVSAAAGASGAGANATTTRGGGGVGGGSAGAAGSSCPAPLLSGDHSHFAAIESVATYAVMGETAQQLRQSINANRGHEYDAETDWNISWGLKNCASPQWTLSLDIEYSMPQWDAPPTVDAALLSSWKTYLDALYCHEYGHGKLGLDCTNEVYEALSALAGNPDCDALAAAASSEFDRVLAGCRTRELAYDADTKHGATMGAVFPP